MVKTRRQKQTENILENEIPKKKISKMKVKVEKNLHDFSINFWLNKEKGIKIYDLGNFLKNDYFPKSCKLAFLYKIEITSYTQDSSYVIKLSETNTESSFSSHEENFDSNGNQKIIITKSMKEFYKKNILLNNKIFLKLSSPFECNFYIKFYGVYQMPPFFITSFPKKPFNFNIYDIQKGKTNKNDKKEKYFNQSDFNFSSFQNNAFKNSFEMSSNLKFRNSYNDRFENTKYKYIIRNFCCLNTYSNLEKKLSSSIQKQEDYFQKVSPKKMKKPLKITSFFN